MTGRIRGFVEVDDAGRDVGFEVAFEGCTAAGNGSEMTGPNEYCGEMSVTKSGIPKYAAAYIYHSSSVTEAILRLESLVSHFLA